MPVTTFSFDRGKMFVYLLTFIFPILATWGLIWWCLEWLQDNPWRGWFLISLIHAPLLLMAVDFDAFGYTFALVAVAISITLASEVMDGKSREARRQLHAEHQRTCEALTADLLAGTNAAELIKLRFRYDREGCR